jgi:hypothetical protein
MRSVDCNDCLRVKTMNNRNFRISSNLSSHGFTFAVKAEYNRLKAEGVSKTYRLQLAIQNVKSVIKKG